MDEDGGVREIETGRNGFCVEKSNNLVVKTFSCILNLKWMFVK